MGSDNFYTSFYAPGLITLSRKLWPGACLAGFLVCIGKMGTGIVQAELLLSVLQLVRVANCVGTCVMCVGSGV